MVLTPIVVEANILTDKLLEGVEKVINKEVQTLEDKIDEFIESETSKIQGKIIRAYILNIVINIIYSTILILAVKRYLT